MTHDELRRARQHLKLSRVQAAEVLETTEEAVRRWERDPDFPTARPAPARVAQLYRAYLQGFRPTTWPE